jgi:hypothetical protein
MLPIKVKVGYLAKFYWESYNSGSLQRLEVEGCMLGIPFSIPLGFKKQRIYVLRSSHAHNKAAECLESCIWLGSRQPFCLFSVILFLESHLLYNEGTLFYKLVCYLKFSSFSCFKLFFSETLRYKLFFLFFIL